MGRLGHRHLTHRRALILITLFTLPLLLLHLGTGDATDMMELFNLVPVREALRDGHWLMPTLNGLPRLEKPPLTVWLPAALATLTGHDSLQILRLPSIFLGLLTCWATYFLAARLGRNRLVGLIAALSLALMNQFMRHARLASYDIYATAFTTVGLLGLYLIVDRPPDTKERGGMERGGGGRRRIGAILLTGCALGLAVLSKGPVPVVTVCLPFGLWLLLFVRGPRLWQALGDIAGAALVSLLVFAPWLIVIGQRYPGAWGVWYREILQNSTAVSNNPAQTAADLRRPIHYYLQTFLWVFPLTPLFIAGLILPFTPPHRADLESPDRATADRQRPRPALWLVWILTVGGLILLTCLAEKKARYALPLFPAMAIMTALVWREFLYLPCGRALNAGTRFLLITLALLYFAIPFTIASAHVLTIPAVQRGVVSLCPANMQNTMNGRIGDLTLGLGIMPPTLWLAATLLILLLGLYLWIVQTHRQFHQAAGVFLAAGWVASLLWVQVYYGVPSFHSCSQRTPAELIDRLARRQTIYSLPSYLPWLPVLFYTDRTFPPLPSTPLTSATGPAQQTPIYLLAPEFDPAIPPPAGLQTAYQEWLALRLQYRMIKVRGLFDDHNMLALYRLESPTSPPATR